MGFKKMVHGCVTASNGVELFHRNGWMLEADVCRAFGVTNRELVRGLPIPRIDFTGQHLRGAKGGRKVYRYRVNDVLHFLESGGVSGAG